ncbi:unnamed protein product [Somion occarium]|uniref:Thioredoxin domain-containing protein n=1 Tax=Somion occarium TaxID=3059160 RepID=A0ABP1CIL8_9APHY
MPLRATQDPADVESVKDVPEKFLVFFSSRDETGRLWCPDCVAVEDFIQRTFEPSDAPSALIVYVGQKPEWKLPSSPFRGPPFNVGSIPTVIRVDDGARLVDGEIQHGLASLLTTKA